MPTAAILSLPVASVDDFEAFEGMRITFPQSLIVSDYFNFDRYNEIVLTSERHLTPTAEFAPGPDAIAAANVFLLDSVLLDDGRTTQNPDPAIHLNGLPFDLSNLFRGGDSLRDVSGVRDYSFGLYRIQPTQGAIHASNNPRTESPDDVGGSLTLASANVLNYFTTLDYPSGDPLDNTCGPLPNQSCRGADDADEFARQRAKLIASLATMDADIVGLLEIENNVSDDATKNRPTLAQTFMDKSTGGIFTAAVNHLKSKGSDCDDVGDPDTGDGSGNCNLTRTAAASAVVNWLASDPTGSGDDDFMVIGDLNSYDKEAPIDALLAAGYTDLILAYRGHRRPALQVASRTLGARGRQDLHDYLSSN